MSGSFGFVKVGEKNGVHREKFRPRGFGGQKRKVFVFLDLFFVLFISMIELKFRWDDEGKEKKKRKEKGEEEKERETRDERNEKEQKENESNKEMETPR